MQLDMHAKNINFVYNKVHELLKLYSTQIIYY